MKKILFVRDRVCIEGNIVIEDYRSDYYSPNTPHRSWKDSLQIMREEVENFRPEDYRPKGIINPHFDGPIAWDAHIPRQVQSFFSITSNPTLEHYIRSRSFELLH